MIYKFKIVYHTNVLLIRALTKHVARTTEPYLHDSYQTLIQAKNKK